MRASVEIGTLVAAGQATPPGAASAVTAFQKFVASEAAPVATAFAAAS
jgi:hypothetical protein